MTRYGRTDKNHTDIVDGLRAVGASVQSLANVGYGVPDLLVGFRGRNYLMEVKTRRGKLRKSQVEWFDAWRGDVALVRTLDDALMIIGAMDGDLSGNQND